MIELKNINVNRGHCEIMWNVVLSFRPPLNIYMISQEGELITEPIGFNIEKGEKPQVLVLKDYIFGSAMNNEGYT